MNVITKQHLIDTIDEIIKFVPPEEIYFLAKLNDIKSSVEFVAPEIEYLWWRQLKKLLDDKFNELESWEQNVLAIFNKYSQK